MHQVVVLVLPVEGVAHLNGDQHRQGHGHWGSRLEHLTSDVGEVLILFSTLHKVGLRNTEPPREYY